MPTHPINDVLHYLRSTLLHEQEDLTDGQLLERFVRKRESADVEVLVRRHGPMVWGVCRRVLGNSHDAEDAFQATFLVLVRKAASIHPRSKVGNWLYGVAHQTALKARASGTKRRRREKPMKHVPEPAESPRDLWSDLPALLDAEVSRLPDKYRAVIVLCELEGATLKEAARQLDLPQGTVASRLSRGRGMLAKRLARHGLAVSGGVLAEVLSQQAASAVVPVPVLSDAIHAVKLVAASPTALTAISGTVTALAEGVIKTMLFHKLAKLVVPLLVLVALSGTACWIYSGQPPRAGALEAAQPPSAPPMATTVGADTKGDPLPAGAVVRFGTVRLRPGGRVKRLAFSPNGTSLVSWSAGSDMAPALCVWDTQSGRLRRRSDFAGNRPTSIGGIAWLTGGRGLALLFPGLPGRGPRLWGFTQREAPPLDGKPFGPGGVVVGGAPVGPAGVPGPDNEGAACYALSPDGQLLAVGYSGKADRDRPIRLYRVKAGVCVNDLPAPRQLARQPGNCETLQFSPDGKRLVVFSQARGATRDRTNVPEEVVVWDVATGQELNRFTAIRPASNGDQRAVAVSNEVLAVGRDDGSTTLWDLHSGQERRLATAHISKTPGLGYGTFAVIFSPDGKTLVTGGRDGKVKLWEVHTGRHLRTLAGHYSWVEALAMSADGQTIASAGQDGIIRLWNTATGADACPQPGHQLMVLCVALSPNGKTAVTAGGDRSLRWWDTRTSREVHRRDLPAAATGLAISPDGRTVLAMILGGGLRTWDLATASETAAPKLPKVEDVGPLVFTPNGQQLIAASGAQISILSWPSLRLVRTLRLPKPTQQPGENLCLSLSVSADGRWLLTVAERSWYREQEGLHFAYAADGVVDVWDLATGKRTRRLAENPSPYKTATFTVDQCVVLFPGGGQIPAHDGQSAQQIPRPIALLDPHAGRCVRAFGRDSAPPGPGARLRYAGTSTLSPDGRTLYVSYSDGVIIGYEVATGQARRVLYGHRGYIGALAVSRDSQRLLSGGWDSTALLWDVSLRGAVRQSKKRLANTAVEDLWKTATGPDAARALEALGALATDPKQAVALVKRHVKPIPAGPAPADMDRLFADLDSKRFASRERASRQLERFGDAAVPIARRKLAQPQSPEVRRRLQHFLEEFDPSRVTAGRLRQLRAIELLEGIATPAARALLTKLAEGYTNAPLTLDAQAALRRLGVWQTRRVIQTNNPPGS